MTSSTLRPSERVCLVIDTSQGQVRCSLDRPRTLIGCDALNDIRLSGPGVRHQHALIYRDGSGTYWLSTACDNPPRLNGATSMETRSLRHGDVIELAGYRMCFEQEVSVHRRRVMQLTVQAPTGPRWVALWDARTVHIGQRDSELNVADPLLGSPHCVLEQGPEGIWLSPCGDELATDINGQRVTMTTLIPPGATLTLGASVVEVYQLEQPHLPPPGRALRVTVAPKHLSHQSTKAPSVVSTRAARPESHPCVTDLRSASPRASLFHAARRD